jgi:fimbrial chaperone protein
MRRLRQGALAGTLIFFHALAQANGIAVHPIRLELEAGQRSATLTVTNDTPETKVLQLSVMQWRQVDGESVYEPTRELIATPVLFRVAPQGRQLVRVGFVNPPAETPSERSYRLYLTEVAEDKGQTSQVRFLLQLGIPLFLAPAKAQDAIDWQLQRQPGGQLRLTAVNRGNRHVRLQSLRLDDARGRLFEQQSLDYLLAGSRRSWLLVPERPPAAGRVRLQAQSGRGLIETELATTPP